jgi:hypothetical protein
MRKVSVARYAFVVLTLSMFAASGADKTVTDKVHGFEITFPEAWKVNDEEKDGPNTRGASAVAQGAKEPMLVNVLCAKRTGGGSAKEFANRYAEYGKMTAKDFKVTETLEFKVGETDAFKMAFTFSYANQITQFQETYVFTKARRYIITANCTAADFDKYAKDIDAIVKSFKLIKAK